MTSIITTNEVDNRDLNKLGRLTSNATNVEVHNRHSTELGRLTSNATQEDPLRVVVSARAETLNGATNMPSARLVGRDGVRPTVVKPPVFAQGGDGGGRDTPVFAQAGAGGGLALEKPTLRMRRVGGPEVEVPRKDELQSLASSAPHNRGTQILNINDGATTGWEKYIQEMNANAKSAEGLASVKPVFAQASAGGTLVVEPKAATATVNAMSTDLVHERSWWLGLPLLHNRRLLWECLEFPAAASSGEGLAKTTPDQTGQEAHHVPIAVAMDVSTPPAVSYAGPPLVAKSLNEAELVPSGLVLGIIPPLDPPTGNHNPYLDVVYDGSCSGDVPGGIGDYTVDVHSVKPSLRMRRVGGSDATTANGTDAKASALSLCGRFASAGGVWGQRASPARSTKLHEELAVVHDPPGQEAHHVPIAVAMDVSTPPEAKAVQHATTKSERKSLTEARLATAANAHAATHVVKTNFTGDIEDPVSFVNTHAPGPVSVKPTLRIRRVGGSVSGLVTVGIPSVPGHDVRPVHPSRVAITARAAAPDAVNITKTQNVNVHTYDGHDVARQRTHYAYPNNHRIVNVGKSLIKAQLANANNEETWQVVKVNSSKDIPFEVAQSAWAEAQNVVEGTTNARNATKAYDGLLPSSTKAYMYTTMAPAKHMTIAPAKPSTLSFVLVVGVSGVGYGVSVRSYRPNRSSGILAAISVKVSSSHAIGAWLPSNSQLAQPPSQVTFEGWATSRGPRAAMAPPLAPMGRAAPDHAVVSKASLAGPYNVLERPPRPTVHPLRIRRAEVGRVMPQDGVVQAEGSAIEGPPLLRRRVTDSGPSAPASEVRDRLRSERTSFYTWQSHVAAVGPKLARTTPRTSRSTPASAPPRADVGTKLSRRNSPTACERRDPRTLRRGILPSGTPSRCLPICTVLRHLRAVRCRSEGSLANWQVPGRLARATRALKT